jgi:hypothetical protein
MNQVWNLSKSTGRARLVLLAIADHQGEIGAWPSISTLARMVNASERTVQRDIQTLVSLGELEVQTQQAPVGGQYKSNLYWVKLSGVTESDSGVTKLTSGVTKSPSGVTTIGALTLNRTLKETKKGNGPHLLPEDWAPKTQDWDIMAEHFPWVDLKKQTHAFRDYWTSQPPSKAKKTDWDATWRNWIRRSSDYNKPAPSEPRTPRHRFTLED